MTAYACPRCGYETEDSCRFSQHLATRKNICKPLLADIDKFEIMRYFNNRKEELRNESIYSSRVLKQHMCHYCDKSFDTRMGRSHHIRKHHPEVKDAPPPIVYTARRQPVRAFPECDTSYITFDVYKSVLVSLYEEVFNSDYLNLIVDIYFNDEHPGNQNIQVINIREQKCKTWNGSTWCDMNLKEACRQMYKFLVLQMAISLTQNHAFVESSSHHKYISEVMAPKKHRLARVINNSLIHLRAYVRKDIQSNEPSANIQHRV